MIIKINDKDITLNNNEVKRAKEVVGKFFKNVEDTSVKHVQKSFYITLLIVAHIMSQQLLDEIDSETLSKYMKMVSEINKTPH